MQQQEKWVELFKKVIGRPPTFEEFQKGKETGFDLKQIKSIAQVQEKDQPITQSSAPKKKKRAWPVFVLSLFLIGSIGAAAYYGYLQTRPEVRIEEFKKAIQQENYTKVAKLLSETQQKWEEKEAKSFIDYLESQEQEGLEEVLASVENGADKSPYKDANGNKLLGLVADGKKWLFFPRYKFITYPLHLKVSSNLTDLVINDETVASGKEVLMEPLLFIPQELKISATSELGEFTARNTIELEKAKNNELSLSLEMKDWTIAAILPVTDTQAKEIRLLINGDEVAQGLEATVTGLETELINVQAQFRVEGELFETEVHQTKISANKPLQLALDAEAQKKLETIVAKKNQKRQPLVLWSPEKSRQLADFMVTWGNSMNQPGYENLTNTETGFVDKNGIRLNDQDVTSEMSKDGTGNSDYQVVAIYRYYYGVRMHTYYFSIQADGTPVVLYSAQNQGNAENKFYMKETANDELKAGFAAIVSQ